MQRLDADHHVLASPQAWVSAKDEGDKVVAFERAGLLWIFNFHPTQSFVGYRVGIEQRPGQALTVALSSDAPSFGGHGRVDLQSCYWVEDYRHGGRPASVRVYIPCRTALVLALS
jgi:1,4-alpha-glucan branching enzyme